MPNKNYHNIKYGLKIWSTDERDLFKEAARLFLKGKIDFVELYVVPDSFVLGGHNFLNDLKNIPTTLHAPHAVHNFDVFKLDDSRIRLFESQVIKTADFLGSKFIVVHATEGDDREVFIKNIKKINDKRILIENATKIGMDNQVNFGYSFEQLEFIKSCGLNFCLDFSHAIKSAISQNLDCKKFVEKLISELNPSYFHICNGKMDNQIDEHRDLFDGEFDLKWIKKTLIGLKKDVYLVFETPKAGKGLENDVKNMNHFCLI